MTVSSDKLREIAGEVRGNASAYSKYIEEIYSKLKGSLHEFWSGTDYDEFLKIMDSKRPTADAVTKSMKETAEYLETKAQAADNM